MQIHLYQTVDSLRFDGSVQSDATSLYGEPKVARKSQYGATEYHYDGYILRFNSADKTLQECTLLPYTHAVINGIKVTWDRDFVGELSKADGDPRESYGFVVFGNLGVAVTGIHDNDESQLAVTVFSKRDRDEFLNRSVPLCS